MFLIIYKNIKILLGKICFCSYLFLFIRDFFFFCFVYWIDEIRKICFEFCVMKKKLLLRLIKVDNLKLIK